MQPARFPSTALDTLRLATILEVDIANALVRVAAGEIESGWIDFATARAGTTRIWSPPSVGEQVIVYSPDGDLEGAFVAGALYCDAHPAPGQTLRELIQFSDGTLIAYDPETHHLEAILCGGGKATVSAPAGITINADVVLNGDVILNGTLTSNEDVIASGIHLKTHKHSGVAAGGAQTGGPV